MKIGKTVLAVLFVIIFILALLTAVDAMRSISYEDIFPDNVNAVIWIHKPLDVPLKILNSTAARNFFKTQKGQEMEKQINAALAALSAPKKKTPPPKIFKKDIEGVTVYFPEVIKPAETSESAPATAEAKAAKGSEMSLDKLEKLMSVGGAVVKNLYIGLYGNPMEVLASGKPAFMFAMDLGRLSVFPRLFLPMGAKPLPANRKPGEEESLPVAFAFYRNMLIAGDPSGIERMIHTKKGTPMTVTTLETPPPSAEGEAAAPKKKVETITLKPLKYSKLWARLKKSMAPRATFNLVVLVPNLLTQLKSDPQMSDAIEQNSAKFGLTRILGLIHSNKMDEKGLAIATEVVFDPPTPVLTFLNQQEREMAWPKQLPDSFLLATGMTVDSYPNSWKALQGLVGEQVSELDKHVKNRFGVEKIEDFLGILGKEVSFMVLAGDGSQPMIFCDSVNPQAKDFMAKLEGKAAESALDDANKAVEEAVSGGAETFAAEAVSKAKEALQSAKSALGDNRRVEAVVLARKAKEFAKAGLSTLVNQASATIEAAMGVGAYTYAPDEVEAANGALKDAKGAYENSQPAAGTDAAKKALSLAKLVLAFGKAGTALENAKAAGADTKAAAGFTAAQTALNNAKAAYKQGQIPNAITLADQATVQALQAQAAASGGKVEPLDVKIQEPVPIDFTIPSVQSPRVVEKSEVFQSVGAEPVDYVFNGPDSMCSGKPDDIDAFLKMPRGEVIKSANLMELMGLMPRETQGLALINGYKALESQGMLPDESGPEESPVSTAEANKPKKNEMKDYIKSLNLMVGGYLVTTDDALKMALVSPIKMFDGSTGTAARSATAALFFLAKWLFYILGLVFLYLTVRMFRKKQL